MKCISLNTGIDIRLNKKLEELPLNELIKNPSGTYGAIVVSGTVYTVNLTAAIILKLIREPMEIEDIYQHMVDRFEATKEEIEVDVNKILDLFNSRGWISHCD